MPEKNESKDLFDGLFQGAESEKYSVLRTFYETKGINFKTDLSDVEIRAITLTDILDEILEKDYGIKLNLKKITGLAKELKVSRDRKGREEAIRAIIGEEKEEKKNLIKRLLGG